MPIKFIKPEPTAEVKVEEKLERLQEPNVTAAKDMPALADKIEEQHKADDEEVKVLWDKRKTPEELEEEAYRKKQAARLSPQPIALDEGLADPIQRVFDTIDSVSEASKPAETPKPTVHVIPDIKAVKPPVMGIKAVIPEAEAKKAEQAAALPATEPTVAGEVVQEPRSLEERVAELESTFSEFDTDLARLERLMATLSKYHPELFKKPVVAPTTQEVADKLALAIKPVKKEAPYVPLDPSVDGKYLAGYDAAEASLRRSKKGR